MNRSDQHVNNSKIAGKVSLISDASQAVQQVDNVEAAELHQKISSQQSSLVLGKWKATGIYGVVALTLIALLYITIQYLINL